MTATISSRPRVPRRAIAALLVAPVLLLSAGCGGSGASESGAAYNDADVTFVTGMLPHHEQAVEMADMVADRDVSPALERLAQGIEDAQQPEIEQMQGLLSDWGVESSTDGMDHSDMDHGDMDMGGMDMGGMSDGMMSSADMTRLDDAADARFETLWLEGMIEHHVGAVAQARAEISDGESAEAIELARDILRTQTQEIAAMERLLAN